ncbi:hypothetical protein SLEP1_g28311 [Rubroshorea leprosula]|uniref:Uncharacterized protein n=1 Tax=Rubroshorea leprosula TaxID=152421 RepID=A0AAV5K0C8_9ROSI|nr:hypothetical protein SLEP1_g28311 [Rubroshorea leprosula]
MGEDQSSALSTKIDCDQACDALYGNYETCLCYRDMKSHGSQGKSP